MEQDPIEPYDQDGQEGDDASQTPQITGDTVYVPFDTSGFDPMGPIFYGVGNEVQGVIIPETPDTPPQDPEV